MKKNLLFVCPKFYNYHLLIINNLIEKGYDVTFLPDLAEDKFIFTFYKKFRWIKKIIHYRFNNIVMRYVQKNEYAVIFIIKGKLFSESLIYKLNQINNYNNSYKIMYQWDSDSSSNYSRLIKYFDKVLTFDPNDSVKLNIEYLPLFCSQKIKENVEEKYDILLISSYSKERYLFTREIINNSAFSDYRINIFIYQPFLSYIKSLIIKEYLPLKYISFSKISIQKYFDELSRTIAVLDITHSHQSGLSMRTIETLVNKKKLYTNNKHIVNETFYNSSQIKVYENSNEIFNKEFLNQNDYNNSNLKELYLSNWINSVFLINNLNKKYR